MWVAFIFFGLPARVNCIEGARIYCIEGTDTHHCHEILHTSFGLEGKVEHNVSDLFIEDSLKELLKIFNVGEEVFNTSISPRDPIFYRKSLVDDTMPKTLRAIDGEYCNRCRQFFPMAVANQFDGFICWSCRDQNPWLI